jgi:hypothetical protein
MSLLNVSSPWINDTYADGSKKRSATMRSLLEKELTTNNYSLFPEKVEGFQDSQPANIEKTQAINESNNAKIIDLLNKMDTTNVDNAGSSLVDFNPPSRPIVQTKTSANELSPSELLPKNPLQHKPPVFESPKKISSTLNYVANDVSSGMLSNYTTSYSGQPIVSGTSHVSSPYYAKMGIGSSGALDDKLLEKLNYMIHLLEEQQSEKTNNITEEFILYSMVGVFIIYIVDSFARAGKYTR